MSKYKIGDKVKYIGKEHKDMPEFYPAVGTIGMIDRIDMDENYWVQWPKGTTSDSDCWCCDEKDIELVDNIENINMTNEEIWEMLEPKMEKNGLKEYQGGLLLNGRMVPGYHVYLKRQVNEAIAIAYRSGYERAMKGRPFKFVEKKIEKKNVGHWEPIDPNNLPKEGTKVRYARNCKDYLNYTPSVIIIGDTGKVDTGMFGWFGIRLDNPRSSYTWLSFDDGIANCLDMWVEDDE